MKFLLFIFILAIEWPLIASQAFCQDTNYGAEWRKYLAKDSKYWLKMELKKFAVYDLGQLISNNENSFVRATYTGIFGPEYRRIDFYIQAKKSPKKQFHYDIVGKGRLDSSIFPVNGNMELVNVYRFQPNQFTIDPFYLGVFNFQFRDVGSKAGDGSFQGVASIIFAIENKEPRIWWSESGDFRELNNTFVGTWGRLKKDKQTKCIFSFKASGLYVRLPFCEDFYDPRDDYHGEFPKEFYTVIRAKYKPNGWSDYDPDYNHKEDWFRNSDKP